MTLLRLFVLLTDFVQMIVCFFFLGGGGWGGGGELFLLLFYFACSCGALNLKFSSVLLSTLTL